MMILSSIELRLKDCSKVCPNVYKDCSKIIQESSVKTTALVTYKCANRFLPTTCSANVHIRLSIFKTQRISMVNKYPR